MPQNRILIEVSGGCVTSIFSDDPEMIDAVIVDHDVEKERGVGEGIEFTYAQPISGAEKEVLAKVGMSQASEAVRRPSGFDWNVFMGQQLDASIFDVK